MEQPLTIFHTECGRQWGGQELRTLEEVDRARDDGHAAWALVHRDGRMAEHAERRGTPHYRLSMRNSADPVGFAQMARLVWRHRPDVICSHNARDFYLAWPFRAVGIPVLRYRHISNTVKASWSRSFAYRHGASQVVATAKFIKRQLIEHNDVAPERIRVIGEGVDLGLYNKSVDARAVRTELGLMPEHFVVGTVGMVRSDKGYHVIVQAAARLKDAFPHLRFLLVGGPTRDGAYLESVQKTAEKLGVADRLIWTGWREDVPQLMAAMDLFVLASVGVEGQSRVIPEAFALGKPVIGSEVGGIPELVEDGVTGFLVPKENADALAAAITRMVQDEARRTACAEAGHRLALERLDIRRRMEESYALYRTLLR